jgi:hypothetical protein
MHKEPLTLPVLKILRRHFVCIQFRHKTLSTQYCEVFYVAGTEGNIMRLCEFTASSFNMSVECKSGLFQYKYPRTIVNISPPHPQKTIYTFCGLW